MNANHSSHVRATHRGYVVLTILLVGIVYFGFLGFVAILTAVS